MILNLIRVITQKLGIYYHIGNIYANYLVKPKYKKIEKANRVRFDEIKAKSKSTLLKEQGVKLTNSLPNSGGIPIETNDVKIDELNAQIVKNESRKTGVESFDGMALNDAVAIESWKHYSFLDLALVVTEIVKEHSKKKEISILEMGCGAGSMFDFFKSMSASVYLGLDGNPLAFQHSPIITSNKEFFRLVNLQEEINFNTQFDLIYTSEVLEHIREDKTEFFIKTIANHMDSNSIFIGTIATTIMDVHINVHSRDWWLAIFEKHGLSPFANSDIYEKKIAKNHPYNWRQETSHIFALKKR